MSGLEFFLLKGILTQNSNTMELEKFLENNWRLHIQIRATTLKMTSCRTMSKKKKLKKSENSRFSGKKYPFFGTMPLGNFSQMATHRSSSKNTRKN
jgi:hypothetical protein